MSDLFIFLLVLKRQLTLSLYGEKLFNQLRKASKNKVLTKFPSFPPQSLRCRRLCLCGGSHHEVCTMSIRWNKEGCDPHGDQRQ